MGLITLVLVGLIAGWLAGRLVKGGGYGVAGDIAVGVLGAFIGGFLFRVLGLHASGLVGRIIVATCGAVALIYVLRLLKR
ncbi:Uncharacterized membrane protein YeaQ/YmgE, transglycosylase-associated protein family [Methylomagnum ishizawai]|uniref:Uncharacterized membrane protein YeaQ/YmgE, transglycosylase-associated protein family n=1 Tax=Methylomagnum ishizawai TaxID=1760988 RepID=A0A1Y6D8Q1_9GAMM|nr:GlsB/YeaQ/YmgE family stress response membrane protein [Methylomagnum ishizawai]SMF96594.1 Uncharacterized membrane protein YeaQ/YmgE, transglycosylase-associated protein family [Methylomagnum ishizawai]